VASSELKNGHVQSCGCRKTAEKTTRDRHLTPDDIPVDLIKAIQIKAKIEKYLKAI
jgi:hypothetical protein